MSEIADMVEVPTEQRICAHCRWSRSDAGDLFIGQDRAYCAHSSVTSDTGQPVPCESQRFATGSSLLQQCGVDGILFEARQ